MSLETTPSKGPRWETLRHLARHFNKNRVTQISVAEVSQLQPQIGELVQAGVLVEQDGMVRFFHETLYDHVFARAFVEDGRSLAEEILDGPQDLSRRSLIRRILSFERGVDRERYQQSVRTLLESEGIRFLLRDVVFDVLREDPSPDLTDWHLLAPMMIDEESANHPAAWGVATEPAWLDVIHRSGDLLRWMASAQGYDRDRATVLLRHLVRNTPSLAATLMWPFLDLGDDWHRRIRWIVTASLRKDDRRLLDFLIAAVRVGVFDNPTDQSLWIAVHHLPERQPRWGVDLLSEYLRRGLTSMGSDPFDDTYVNHSYYAEEFARALSRRAPVSFAREILPILVGIVERTADPNVDLAQGDPWAVQTQEQGHGLADALYESLESALRRVAERRPASFASLAPALIDSSRYASVRFLLYRTWSANGTVFWKSALEYLLAARDPFRCGYLDSPYWVTRELIEVIQSHAPAGTLTDLESRLLEFYPPWELDPKNRDLRGSSQLTLLDVWSDQHLSSIGRRRLAELRRKFGRSESAAPRSVQVGFVGSPIPEEQTLRMSDKSWLKAIMRYNTEERTSGWLKGGSLELSRILEQRTKEQPERFAKLALRFPLDVDENYADAILRGLGDADHTVSVDLLSAVLRYFFAIPSRPGGRWITRPLAQVAGQSIPFDILDIAAWFATDAPDPQRDIRKNDSENNLGSFGDDLLTAGINSVRGAAAEALSALIWPDAARAEYLKPTLRRLVTDPVIAVRTCAGLTLRSVYRHDGDFAVLLFSELCNTDDVILGTRPIEDFLSVATRSHMASLKPILERALHASAPGIQIAGGRQVTLAALANGEDDLFQEATAVGSPSRIGVAQVAAHNVHNPELAKSCARWLEPLFFDDDTAVRLQASNWVSQLGKTGIGRLRDVALAYVESPAYLDNEAPLLRALDDSTVPIVELAQRALQRFVDHRGLEMRDSQKEAAMSAGVASKLAVRAYTSAPTIEAREAALDVIDSLLSAKVSEMTTFMESLE